MITEGFKRTVSLAYIIGIASQICELTFYAILFKFLPVEQIGVYSWTLAIAAFFTLSLDLGLNQTLIRAFSKGQLHLKSAVFGSSIIRLPIILIAALLFFAWYTHSNPSSEQYLALFLIGIIQIVVIWENICQSWLRGNGKQTTGNIVKFLGSIGRLGVAFILIYWWQVLSVPALFAALLIIHIIILLILVFLTFRIYHETSIINPNPSTILSNKDTIKKLMHPSLIFGFIGLLTVIQNRLDWLMVSNFVSKIELANYSLANKIYEVFLMFIGISFTTAYPWMCKNNSSQRFKVRFNIFLSLVVFFGITASLIAALYVSEVLQFLWGAKYEPANQMIQLLMFGATFSVISGLFYHLLISRRLEKKILPVVFIATAFQVIANFLLIPAFGGFGAVVGMLVLIAITTVGLFWLVHKEQIITFEQLKRLLIFSVIMSLFAGLFWALDVSMIFGTLTLLALGIAGMYFILINSKEKELLMVLISRHFLKKELDNYGK